MRVYFLSFVVVLTAIFITAPSAWSATYQTTLGDVGDILSYSAIQQGFFLPHYYSGPNLEPYAGLSGASLQDASLSQADLTLANLISADLSYSMLGAADLSFALLIDADLSFSLLQDADLTSAFATGIDLRNADLFRAELGSTNLTDADLRGANLYAAKVVNTVWTGALYDENTIFPDGAGIDEGWPWGLDGWISPWNAGMIPAPEPASNTMMLAGVAGLAGLARIHARRRSRVAGLT